MIMAFNYQEFSPPPNAVYIAAGSNIQSVVDNYAQGTAFVLGAGIHRLQTISPKQGMSFFGEMDSNGSLKATISGARLITSFQSSNGLYIINGQTQAEIIDNSSGNQLGWERAAYLNDVYIDNQPLKHVGSIDQVVAGTFYFDYANDRVYIADNPYGKIVEVSDKQAAFIDSASNVKIRNLNIEKYATRVQGGAINSGSNWTIEGNSIQLNHGAGISLDNNCIARNNYIYKNGAKGLGGGGGDDVLIEANEIAFNNFNKFNYGFDVAGIKSSGHNATIRGNYIHDNDSRGIWVDVNAENVLIENNVVRDNTFAGIVYECSFRGIIRDNQIGYNGRAC
jgi:parallel beta-helix repeat protein